MFAKGVLCFCKAEALLSGHLRSLRMEPAALVERKRLQALEAFQARTRDATRAQALGTC